MITVIFKKLVLQEVAPGWTAEEVIAETEATLAVSPDVHDIQF